ncbi:hypothetical protein O181_010032 [Austropuccinia psidii MF-1]|uniref:Uncharacterized protein n=1 Tax=Austropuccinia psidii MF-1 TaxID=1389203 RepID=A0A9Q3BRT5_9BASI|nr:hypothetical protein [Austropuccinia psidii MF-1]
MANQLSSGFTPFRSQQISWQESPFFTIPGSFQEKTRIQGQKQDNFQPEEERVRPNDPEAVRFGERSAQEPEVVVNNSRISSPINRNITPTQIEHDVVPPENEESQTPYTISRELEHAVKCRCNHNCTLDEIANILQDVTKRTNIGKYTPYKSSGFKEKQPFRVELKENPREMVEEVAKKKNCCNNCGSTDYYSNNCPKAKKEVYAIEKFPEEESPTEDSDSDSMGDSIREQSDEEQDPRGNPTRKPVYTVGSRHATRQFQQKLVQTHTFLVTPTKGMA